MLMNAGGNTSKVFQIITERLILKRHKISNYRKMNDWENDQELLYFNDCQEPDRDDIPLSESREYVKNLIRNTSKSAIHYAIYKRKENLFFFGFGTIAFIDHFNKSCKLSIVIGEKSEWGQGFAKEALHGIIEFCFKNLKMNRIGAEIYSFNKRSINLFKGLGFKKEGEIREAVLKKEGFVNEFIFGLLNREWRKKGSNRAIERKLWARLR